MDLEEGTREFHNLLSKIHPRLLPQFISWIQDHVEVLERDLLDNTDDDDDDYDDNVENTDVILESIRDDLRQIIPFSGIFPSENIVSPTIGPNSNCTPQTTVHIDAFLYEEDDLKTLESDGKVSLSYCKDCNSKNVGPFTLITHSASQAQVKYIFQYLLPDLTGKTLLDVGSRFGPMLYGAYLLTNANIEGVEIDENLCKIQQQIIKKYQFDDRIRIYHNDILDRADLLEKADIIILNNVFEFFMPLETQTKVWQFLSSHITRRGVMLITHPSIEESLKYLKVDIKVNNWVKEVDISSHLSKASLLLLGKRLPSETDLINLHLYETL